MSILIRLWLVVPHAEARPIAADILVDGDHIARVCAAIEPAPDVTVIDARDKLGSGSLPLSVAP